MKLLLLPSEAHMSILVSGFDIWRRSAACSPIGVGGLLDRPPFGEAGGCESHFLPAWPPSRALRYHGARRRGQDLPHVLPLACESHSQRNTLFVLYWRFHSVLFPSSTITRSQPQILAWGLWFYLCVWRRRTTGCGWYWGSAVISPLRRLSGYRHRSWERCWIMWSCVRREEGGLAPLLTSDLSLTGAFKGAIWLYGSWFGRQSLSNKCDAEKKNPSLRVGHNHELYSCFICWVISVELWGALMASADVFRLDVHSGWM